MPSLPQINGWQWTFNRVTGKWSLTQTTGSMHALISRLLGDGSITDSAMMRSRTPSDASSWYNPVSPSDDTPWVDSPSIPTSIDTAQSWADSYRSELRHDTASPISSYSDEDDQQQQYRNELDTSTFHKGQRQAIHPGSLQPKPLSFNKDSQRYDTSEQSKAERGAKRFSFGSSDDRMSYEYDQSPEYVQISWRNKKSAPASQSSHDDPNSSNKMDEHDVSPLTTQDNSSMPAFRDPVWQTSEPSIDQHQKTSAPVPHHSQSEPLPQIVQPSFSFSPAYDRDQPQQQHVQQLNRAARSTERPMSVQYQSVPFQANSGRPVSQIITSMPVQHMNNAVWPQPANLVAPQPHNVQTPQSHSMQAPQPHNLQTPQPHNLPVPQPQSMPQQMQPPADASMIPQGYCLVPMQHVQNNTMAASIPQHQTHLANNGQYVPGITPSFNPPPVSHKDHKSPFLVIDANSKAELKAMGKSISSWTSKTTKTASKWLDGKV